LTNQPANRSTSQLTNQPTIHPILDLLRAALVCAVAAIALSAFPYQPRPATALGALPTSTPTPRPTVAVTATPLRPVAPLPGRASPTTTITPRPGPKITVTAEATPVGRPAGLPPITPHPPAGTVRPTEEPPQPVATPTPQVTEEAPPTGQPPAAPPQDDCPTLMCRLLRQLVVMSSLPYPEETTQKQYASNNHSSPERFWDYFNSDQLFSTDERYGYNTGGEKYTRYRILTGYDGRTEYEFLPRTEGPGYISRIWFTHRQHDRPEADEVPDPEWGFFGEAGNIRFYFDDEPTPRVDMPVTQFFKGETAPFLAPLVSHYRRANGGNISYLPMPFYKSVRATLAPATIPEGKYVGPRMFQVAVKHFTSEMEPFESFQMYLNPQEAAELERARRAWSNRGANPMPPSGETKTAQKHLFLDPGGSASISLDEAGTITALRVRVADRMEGGLELRIYWDGSEIPAIAGSLRALFGTAEALRYTRSLPLGTLPRRSPEGLPQNEFYNYFPMPYKSAQIVVTNHSGDPAPVQLDIAYRPGEPAPRRLHALSKTERMTVDDPENYAVLELTGSGRYVGLIFTGHEVDRTGQPYYREPLPDVWRFPYLEGDVDIWVDGELALPGTGAEDDFNGGYYFIWYDPDDPGSSQYPLAGCTWKDAASLGEVASLYRFYLTDSVEFKNSLRVEIEHGIMDNNLSVTYSTTAFWYQ
jgi:hypothetical protein